MSDDFGLDEFARDVAAHVRTFLAGVREIATGESPDTVISSLIVQLAQVSMAKMNNVNVALEIARRARTILGANGILDEYPVMRHMANLESVYTYEGAHDLQVLMVGQQVTGIPAYR